MATKTLHTLTGMVLMEVRLDSNIFFSPLLSSKIARLIPE